MNSRMFRITCLVLTILFSYSALTLGQDLKPVQLLEPQMEIGRPLMQVLKDRRSSRSYSDKMLDKQVLSNLLWAGFGINQPESGKRTAPSAHNWQEIDIYVATGDGLYLYDAKKHMLNPIHTEDIRAVTGTQSFVKEAPVNLVFVADYARTGKSDMDEKVFYSTTDAGFISQNVYLYCASEGLATVVRGLVDRPALARAMKLRSDQRIILAQSVGYPKK